MKSWTREFIKIRKIDKTDPKLVQAMSTCFPIPEKKSIADAMSNLVEIYSKFHRQCEREDGISWKSNEATILEVTNQFDRLRSL